MTTKLPQGVVNIWVKIRSPSGGETSASVTCEVHPASVSISDDQAIENTLDNTEEAEHTVNAAAVGSKSLSLSNEVKTTSPNFHNFLKVIGDTKFR